MNEAISSMNLDLFIAIYKNSPKKSIDAILESILSTYLLSGNQPQGLKILRFLIQQPEVRTIDVIRFFRHPSFLHEFMLEPHFFFKYRNFEPLRCLYQQALKYIPVGMEDILLDTQPGTLKDLARRRVIRLNLDGLCHRTGKSIQRSAYMSNLIDWSRVNPGRKTSSNRYYTVDELRQLVQTRNVNTKDLNRKEDLIRVLRQLTEN